MAERKMMGKRRAAGLVLAAGMLGLAGCGVPREAGVLAAAWARPATTEVAASEVGTGAGIGAGIGAGMDAAAVRAELAEQARRWTELETLLGQRTLGGIAVDAEFVGEVRRAAAAARRQAELSRLGQDDPALNQQVLERLRGMWASVDLYLNGAR